jgi:hypothetical protein
MTEDKSHEQLTYEHLEKLNKELEENNNPPKNVHEVVVNVFEANDGSLNIEFRMKNYKTTFLLSIDKHIKESSWAFISLEHDVIDGNFLPEMFVDKLCERVVEYLELVE